jgi:hypothetical protein
MAKVKRGGLTVLVVDNKHYNRTLVNQWIATWHSKLPQIQIKKSDPGEGGYRLLRTLMMIGMLLSPASRSVRLLGRTGDYEKRVIWPM